MRPTRLLDEGQFVATYKYALLSAIADLAVETGDDSVSELPISVERIAEKFIEYYWRQVRPYRGEIRQQNKGKPAEILRHLVDAQKGCTQLSEFRDNSAAHASLVNQVTRVIRQMPLWKLQTVSGVTLPFLYDAPEVNGAIVLKPGVAYCFRAFHGFIRRLLQAEWLSYVRAHRGNLSIIGDTSDLDAFLFGSERGSPANVKPLLMELQHGECIYRRQSLRGAGQVDHFIPWSRYPPC